MTRLTSRLLAVTTLAVTTLALATPATGQTTRTETGDDLERSLEILRGLDGTRTSVNYVDTSLEEIIEDLNWFLAVPLSADWDSLLALGIDADSELTLRLEDAPLATVLAAVAFQLGTGFDRPRLEVFRAGMLVLTSEEGTERMRVSDVYDVRDLVADDRALDELRRTAPSRVTPPETEPAAASAGEGEDADAPPPARETRPMTPGVELMTLICEHVDPDAWLEFGGTRATISERDGVLLVSAAPTVHRSFRDVLRRLRRVYATQVTIEAAIVDVPRPLFDRLVRRHERTSAALGRALLATDEAKILWRGGAGATMNERLTFESKGESASTAIQLVPTLDRATGVLGLEVQAGSRHGVDERTLRTSVKIPYRDGGATLELPAAVAGESVRLLVLLPLRG